MFRSKGHRYRQVATTEEQADHEEDAVENVQNFLKSSRRYNGDHEQELEDFRRRDQELETAKDDQDDVDITVKKLNLDFSQDHTANQRTMMAWTRTSLSMISIGLTLMKLFGKEDEVLGFVFIVLGGVYSLVSSFRFYKTFDLLDSGKFRTNNTFVCITSILALLGNIVLVVLLHFKSRG